MIYKRGDVVLANFPFTNFKRAKPRPALIVQANNLQTGLSQTVLLMITSNLRRTGPTRVFFTMNSAAGKAMGLRTDSVVVADSVMTLEDKEIYIKLGHCPTMHLVDDALRITLGL